MQKAEDCKKIYIDVIIQVKHGDNEMDLGINS